MPIHSTLSHYPVTLGQINVRVIQDSSNRDGWITRSLDDDKVCFISNLGNVIMELIPGQVWTATVVKSGPKYKVVTLDHEARANS